MFKIWCLFQKCRKKLRKNLFMLLLMYVQNNRLRKTWIRKCLKRPVSEDPSKSQLVKGCQTLLKSALQHFYHVSLLWEKLSWILSLLVKFEIRGLFINTFTVNHDYSVRNTESLPQPIQMQLSEKQKSFCKFLPPFLQSRSNFENFEKKMSLIADVFPKLQSAKNMVT